MKISIKTRSRSSISIETDHLLAFCGVCKLFIGSVEIVKGSDVGEYRMGHMICNKCIKSLNIPNLYESPKVAFS